MIDAKRDKIYEMFASKYPGGNKKLQYEFSRSVAEERMDMWMELLRSNEKA